MLEALTVPYKCTFCNASFETNRSLKNHERWHNPVFAMKMRHKLHTIPKTEEQRRRISQTLKEEYSTGKITVWSKGLTKDTSSILKSCAEKHKGGHRSNETKEKMRQKWRERKERISVTYYKIRVKIHYKRTPWNKGKSKLDDPRIADYSVKVALAKKGKWTSRQAERHWSKLGYKPWNLGKNKQTDERLGIIGEKIAKALKGNLKLAAHAKEMIKSRNGFLGSSNPNWKGGFSHEPYNLAFRRTREIIKMRDNYECQICGLKESEVQDHFYKSLLVHHINRNKKDDRLENLVTVCLDCHRQLWGSRKVKMELDEIVSIEPLGEQVVYDVFVPVYHNFILGNNVISHNCEKYLKERYGLSDLSEGHEIAEQVEKRYFLRQRSLEDWNEYSRIVERIHRKEMA